MKQKFFYLLGAVALTMLSFSCRENTKVPNPEDPGNYLMITSSDEWGNESLISNVVYDDQAIAPAISSIMLTSKNDAMTAAGLSTSARYAMNKAMYQSTANAMPSVVHIKFRRNADVQPIKTGAAKTGLANIDRASAVLGAGIMFEPMFVCGEVDKEAHRRNGLDLWYRVYFDQSKVNMQKVISTYDALPEIEMVESVKRIKPASDETTYVSMSKTATGATKVAELPFNDPKLNLQWHYDNLGLDERVNPRANVNLFAAWAKTAGDRDIIVAITDSGIDYNHEDLSEAMWVNEGETPNNNIDDDGNGFIDDVHGFNFAPKLKENGYYPDPPYIKVGTIEPKSHGTHVAGTVGATNNNGKGVCGVAGGTGKGDGVRLMTAQVFGSADQADGLFMAEAIIYSADQGAVISQNSWSYADVEEGSIAIEAAIDYFIAEAGRKSKFPNSPMIGGVVIASTGNANSLNLAIPAKLKTVISVSAINHLRTKSDHSNFGDKVTLTAPGGNYGGRTYPDSEVLGVYSTDTTNNYCYKSGTSMASPHVSGIAALIIAQNKGNITPEQVRRRLIASCETLADTDPASAGFLGAGLVNANNALRTDDKKAPSPITDLELSKTGDKSMLKWTVPADENDEVSTFTVYFSKTPITADTKLEGLRKYVATYPTTAVAGNKFSHEVKK